MSQRLVLLPDRGSRIRVGRIIGVVSMVFGIYALVVLPLAGLGGVLVADFIPHSVLTSVGFGAFALVAVPKQPFNNSVWVAVWAGLISGVSIAAYSTSFVVMAGEFGTDFDVLKSLAPVDTPLGGVLYSFIGPVLLSFLLVITVGLLLFPDGRLPSPPWRFVAWVSVITGVVFAIAMAHEFRPSSQTPFSAGSDRWTGGGRFVEEIMVVAIATALAALISAIVRYRESTGPVRQQYKWMGLGCGLFVAAMIVIVISPGGFVADLGEQPHKWVAALLGTAGIMTGYAIAVAKYRLYDVDLVISKALVYGSLAAFIAAVYIGVVVGVSALLNTGGEASTWLGVSATVGIAIAFQPLRRRLEKVANRMVYGRRVTPYEVLSSFSQSVAAVDPRVLGQIARSLTEGTIATAATIWIDGGDRLNVIASWPESADKPGGSRSETDHVVEVTHDQDRLGAVSLTLPVGQPIPANDVELVEHVTAGLGLALRNLQLTERLERRVEQLRESRRRVVAVQDQTRQILERDLHDGAQQRLVALKIKVGLGGAIALQRGLHDVKEVLDTVKEETDLTIESLRGLARGIYPPLLESEGLGAALTAQLRRSPLPITVQSAGIGRYPREIESTVYFCVLEAVQNAVKHARAKSVLVAVSEDRGSLSFEVRDDGEGFDTTATRDGHGLQNMEDRLDAVNGTFYIQTTSNHGTRIVGTIPVEEMVPA